MYIYVKCIYNNLTTYGHMRGTHVTTIIHTHLHTVHTYKVGMGGVMCVPLYSTCHKSHDAYDTIQILYVFTYDKIVMYPEDAHM